MAQTRFDSFFNRATACQPFAFQERFARDLPCLVRVPTGLGKTAMAVLGWLWRRQAAGETVRRETPRRLVYCLPMRVLVEQTRDAADKWLATLGLGDVVQVHVLMGGEQADDWDLFPERDAILIGTQDMLLSRALNRGYGMSRYRWPVHFGLLNNNCLWIFDEVQLMDAGVATSAQLEAFRRLLPREDADAAKTRHGCRCVWMSATLKQSWLHTVDCREDWLGEPLELTDVDLRIPIVKERFGATKPLQKASAIMGDAQVAADAIARSHQAGSRTLAVFNTVDRAINVYRQLKKDAPVEPVLIHSRFRPDDRQAKLDRLLNEPPDEGTIAITTQVVEAGVDVSARVLFTELAPWASLVQRFGRCNRRGEFNKAMDARVDWFDWLSREQFKTQYVEEQKSRGKTTAPKEDEIDQKYVAYLDGIAKPYSADELRSGRDQIIQLADVRSASLDKAKLEMELEPTHVIRRRDLIDLFDTTPDLAGNDIDISRFIRSSKELDVRVFWRDVPKDVKKPDPDQDHGKAPDRRELCPVPFYTFQDFVARNKRSVWRWDTLDKQWMPARRDNVYPGQMFLVCCAAGGYDADVGWNPKSKASVPPVDVSHEDQEAYDRDPESAAPWQTIAEHTDDVVAELRQLLDGLAIEDEIKRILLEASRWHDWGKIHDVFQDAIVDAHDHGDLARPDGWRGRRDVGKAPNKPDKFWRRYARRHFRHELASALAMMQAGLPDLAVYLVAAHHGKVRLSIRSLPREKTPDEPARLFARGVWDGDQLPPVELGGGVTAPSITLSLDCMQLGRSENGHPSWAERMLKLRDDAKLGPFRLAYLEALLRVADMRASRRARAGAAEPETSR